VVAGAGARGIPPAAAPVSAYDEVGASWDADATRVYGPLADALVASCPLPLDGLRVLDVGSGTGAVAAALWAAGARPVAIDSSPGMAAHQGGPWPVGVGDVVALPFRTASFDAATAGFLLNHLPPEPALREMARIVRSDGAVVATTWAADPADQVKGVIDERLRSLGWAPPDWYLAMKVDILPISGDPARLAAAAERAGLVDVETTVRSVDVGLRDPRAVVGYRFGTAHVAPWVATLSPAARAGLVEELSAAVAPLVAGWQPAVVFMQGRTAGQSTRVAAARSSAAV
jgi:SAM-dependent methyltransferase